MTVNFTIFKLSILFKQILFKQILIKMKSVDDIIDKIQLVDNNYIDKHNILNSTMTGMHKCLDDITQSLSVDTILVDGNHFNSYYSKEQDDFIENQCVIKGDNIYKSIAAASILAKTFRDNYILELVEQYPELKKYGIEKNKGYGTKQHMEAIKEYGITQWHRTSFSPCKGLTVNQMKE